MNHCTQPIKKSDLGDLALFGCRRAFEVPLAINRPNTGDKDTFQSILDTAWEAKRFTNNGPCVCELQTKLKNFLSVRHCIPISSRPLAMAILVHPLGLKEEVIPPSFTIASTAHVLSWVGVRPVFCDIDPQTQNISPGDCERLINAASSAVIPTHMWGTACKIDDLGALFEVAGMSLMFDAALEFGCTHNGTMIGVLVLLKFSVSMPRKCSTHFKVGR